MENLRLVLGRSVNEFCAPGEATVGGFGNETQRAQAGSEPKHGRDAGRILNLTVNNLLWIFTKKDL